MKNIIFILLLASCSTGTVQESKQPITRDSMLVAHAKEVIKGRINTPSTFQFVSGSRGYEGKRKGVNVVDFCLRFDAQNVYGAYIREVDCVSYQYNGGDSLSIDSYKVVQ